MPTQDQDQDPKIVNITYPLPGRSRGLAEKTVNRRRLEQAEAAKALAQKLATPPPPNPPPEPLSLLHAKLGEVVYQLAQKPTSAQFFTLAERKQALEREIRRAEALEQGLPDPLPPPEPPRVGPKVQKVLPHQPPPGWKGFP